ncbi:hypothetical protein PN498_03915 [Oscillatoria sp. CS-180]|uniref:hypothetical protein n=1 Tax=Oscillatoria sp. CS-180 TaxID=3021720 RepID=UPI00232E527F|nr:hypothetical protein [Oscillatoria sp. CS-180]MDB9525122.1 hypothetical protein [Oscillatoria sp. CS-180]
MQRYSPELEEQMQRYYQSLSEKDRRYAAIEALKLGHGGMSYITNLFGCHAKPVRRGLAELQDEQALSAFTNRGVAAKEPWTPSRV